MGAEVSGFKLGDEVYGATNEQFSGAYAEYALPSARMMAQKPRTLNFIEAASAPVVAVTAFAMKGDEERIREGGCEAYLSKPISVGKFIETIRQFLGSA